MWRRWWRCREVKIAQWNHGNDIESSSVENGINGSDEKSPCRPVYGCVSFLLIFYRTVVIIYFHNSMGVAQV